MTLNIPIYPERPPLSHDFHLRSWYGGYYKYDTITIIPYENVDISVIKKEKHDTIRKYINFKKNDTLIIELNDSIPNGVYEIKFVFSKSNKYAMDCTETFVKK